MDMHSLSAVLIDFLPSVDAVVDDVVSSDLVSLLVVTLGAAVVVLVFSLGTNRWALPSR